MRTGLLLAWTIVVLTALANPAAAERPWKPWGPPFGSTPGKPVVFGQVRKFTDGSGDYRILGELKNVSGKHTGLVSVSAIFYDKRGKVITSDSAAACTWFIRAGATSWFRFHVFGPARPVARVEMTIRGYWVRDGVALPELPILNRGSSFRNSTYHVTGIVKNGSPRPMLGTLVCGGAYTKAGRLLAVSSTYTDPGDLAPGGRGGFDLEFFDLARRPYRARLLSDGIPDLP